MSLAICIREIHGISHFSPCQTIPFHGEVNLVVIEAVIPRVDCFVL